MLALPNGRSMANNDRLRWFRVVSLRVKWVVVLWPSDDFQKIPTPPKLSCELARERPDDAAKPRVRGVANRTKAFAFGRLAAPGGSVAHGARGATALSCNKARLHQDSPIDRPLCWSIVAELGRFCPPITMYLGRARQRSPVKRPSALAVHERMPSRSRAKRRSASPVRHNANHRANGESAHLGHSRVKQTFRGVWLSK